MRVAYLIPEFPGQTHTWMWRELSALREHGVDVRLVSTRRPGTRDKARHPWSSAAARETFYLWNGKPSIAPTLWAGLTHLGGLARAARLAHELPLDPDPRFTPNKLIFPAMRLAAWCRRQKIDHLHVHSAGNAAVLAMMSRLAGGPPFSLVLNANLDWWGGAMKEKFQAAAFTAVITQWMLDDVRNRLPEVPPEKLLLCRIGVDPRAFVPRTGDRPAGPPVIFCLGRLHASKGMDDLLRAVGILRDAGRDVRVQIGGAGPMEQELKSLTAALEIGDRMELLGSLGEDQCITRLQAADVFCLPSHAEPLGVVYMEAMSCGLPTIGTSAGGVKEIITDGQDGLLVPPKNPQALADALSRVLDDPSLHNRLAVNGRQTIINHYDSREISKVLLARLQQSQGE